VNTVRQKSSLPAAARARLSSDTFWMAVCLFVLVSKVGEWVQALSGPPLVKITFAITLIVALRAGKLPSRIRAFSLRLARPAIYFLLLAMVSIVWSIYKSQSLSDMQSAAIYLVSLLLLVKITATVRDLRRLLTGLAAAGVVLAIGAVLHFGGGRATMIAWDSNDIAYTLVTLLPIILAQRSGRWGLARFAVYAAALLLVVATFLTGSRGGIIGLGVVVAGLVAFPVDTDRAGRPLRFTPGRALLRLVPTCAVAALLWAHLPSDTTERIATLENIGSDYNMSDTLQGSRTLIWRRDIELAIRRPIGYGLGSSAAVDGLLAGGQYKAAHNSLVQVFVELGVVGLILYLLAYIRCWRGLVAVYRAHRALSDSDSTMLCLYARALCIGFAGNFAAGFFLSQAYSGLLWMLIGVSAAFVRFGAPAYGVIAGPRPARTAGAEMAVK
jgi:O-antigen ligase